MSETNTVESFAAMLRRVLVTPENFHESYNLNVLGVLLTTKEAVKDIGTSGGNVINIGALVSTTGFPGAVVYNATKGAIDTITLTLANELGAKKIRVNAINPGPVATETASAMLQRI